MEADAKMGEGNRTEVHLNRVKVSILGEEYSIRSDSDPKYVQRIAAKVDKELAEMTKQLPNVPRERLAILLSLNLMDRLEQRAARQARVDKKAAAAVPAVTPGVEASPGAAPAPASAGSPPDDQGQSSEDGGLFGSAFEPQLG